MTQQKITAAGLPLCLVVPVLTSEDFLVPGEMPGSGVQLMQGWLQMLFVGTFST